MSREKIEDIRDDKQELKPWERKLLEIIDEVKRTKEET